MFSIHRRTSSCTFRFCKWFRKKCAFSNCGVLKLHHNISSTDAYVRTYSHITPSMNNDLKKNCLKNEFLQNYIRKVLKEYNEYLIKGSNALKLETDLLKIQRISELMSSLEEVGSNIDSLMELKSDSSSDESFIKSVNEELTTSEGELIRIEEELIAELIPTDEEERCSNIVVEVSGGAGGQESMLFAKEIHDAYLKYFGFIGWKCELSDCEITDIGGLRNSSILVSGQNSYKLLRFEGGVHRVQRVPKTDSGGRMHTSTITVSVYPQPTNIDITINDDDVKLETKTARGPGGQHVNKIQTAVRLHHLPTGIIVECQTSRSQSQNKATAYQKLRLKLFQLEQEKQTSIVQSTRKSQVQTKSRNEKIRTYNYSQDRITDHRFRKTINNISRYMEGGAFFHSFLEDILMLHYEQKKNEFLQKLKTLHSDN